MNNTSKLLVALIGVGIIVVGVLWYKHEPVQEPLKGVVVAMGEPIDIIGTHISTTTTYEYFNAYTQGSTTAIKRIDSYVDTVTFTLDAVASTTVNGTAGLVYFSILGSNDRDCDTATTTTSLTNTVITTDIRWFDLGTNLLNLAGSATLPTATSTWVLSGYGTGARTQIVLTDVNTKCIAFQANSTTTDLQVQMVTRSEIFN